MTTSTPSVTLDTLKNLVAWILISTLCVSSALGENERKILEELRAASEGYGILSNVHTLIDLASSSARPPGSFQLKSADSSFRRFITFKDDFVVYTFKITKANQSSSAFFMTDKRSKLTFKINELNLFRCEEEYLYVNVGATIESTLCGGSDSVASRGSRFLLLQFGRQLNTGTVFDITVKAVPDVDAVAAEITGRNSRLELSFIDSQICSACGNLLGSPTIRPRVLGGYTARLTENPWIVGLHIYTERSGPKSGVDEGRCGASILNQRHVLTAAHCLSTLSASKPAKIISMLVVAGSELGFDAQMSDVQSQKIRADDWYIYHYYDRDNKVNQINDIAVVRLAQDLQFNNRVAPVCLAPHHNFHGSDVTVAGYGDLGDGTLTSHLQAAKLSIRPSSECDAFWVRAPNFKFKDQQICLYSPSKDACSGDSGGPAVIKWRNKAYQVGIVSFGLSCTTNSTAMRYGGFTRVSSFTSWIQTVVRGPTC